MTYTNSRQPVGKAGEKRPCRRRCSQLPGVRLGVGRDQDAMSARPLRSPVQFGPGQNLDRTDHPP